MGTRKKAPKSGPNTRAGKGKKDRPPHPRSRFPNLNWVWSGGGWKCRAFVRRDGKVATGSLTTDQKEAHAEAGEIAKQLELLGDGEILTVGDAIRAVTAQMEKKNRAPGTIRNFLEHMEVVMRTFDEDVILRSITPDALEHFATKRLSEGELRWVATKGGEEGEGSLVATGRPVGPNTVLKDIGALGRCILMADLPNPRKRCKNLPERVSEVQIHWAWDKCVKFVRDMRAHKDPTGVFDSDICQLVLLTGIRHNELMLLRREHIRFDADVITMTEIGKANRHMPITLSPKAAALLTRLLDVASARDDNCDAILPRPEYLNDLHDRWKGLLNEKKFTIRIFRRAFGTRGYERSGRDIVTAMRMLRHSDVRTTQRYLGLTDSQLYRVHGALDDDLDV